MQKGSHLLIYFVALYVDLQQSTTASCYQSKEDNLLGDSNDRPCQFFCHQMIPISQIYQITNQNVDHASNPSVLNKASHLFHKQKQDPCLQQHIVPNDSPHRLYNFSHFHNYINTPLAEPVSIPHSSSLLRRNHRIMPTPKLQLKTFIFLLFLWSYPLHTFSPILNRLISLKELY